MTQEKYYHLYIQRSLKLLTFGLLGIFTLLGFLLAFGVLDGPPQLIGVLWLAIVSWNWYWVLTLPHTITLTESGQVEFISILRRRKVTMREIISVKPEGQFGFLAIKTSIGKIRVLNQFDGFHDFLTLLKTVNPNVKLRGC